MIEITLSSISFPILPQFPEYQYNLLMMCTIPYNLVLSKVVGCEVLSRSLTLSSRGLSLYVRICRLQTADSDVYNEGPRAEKIKIFLMVVDP